MTRTCLATVRGVVTILVMLLPLVLAAPVTAADEERRPAQTRFEGQPIDLRGGWGDAQTCVVWNVDGETDCYRSEEAANAAVARRNRDDVRQQESLGTCADWLRLYEHRNYAGRSLRFRDRGYWQDLASWGFANQTSSFITGACGVTFRDSAGSVYPGYSGPYYAAASMAFGWDDRVRYLRLG